MDQPYRFLKNIMQIGNSAGVLIPQVFFKFRGNESVKSVIMEVQKDKIIIKPSKK